MRYDVMYSLSLQLYYHWLYKTHLRIVFFFVSFFMEWNRASSNFIFIMFLFLFVHMVLENGLTAKMAHQLAALQANHL